MATGDRVVTLMENPANPNDRVVDWFEEKGLEMKTSGRQIERAIKISGTPPAGGIRFECDFYDNDPQPVRNPTTEEIYTFTLPGVYMIDVVPEARFRPDVDAGGSFTVKAL